MLAVVLVILVLAMTTIVMATPVPVFLVLRIMPRQSSRLVAERMRHDKSCPPSFASALALG
jgi:hypothetical protein